MNLIAKDRFETYFEEKLWEMIPAIYRHEDGLADNPGVLRGLVEVMAQQAALLRRSQDSLWDDQFIELCNDWAVPYIADLLGTRLISALNKRGRRVDVAKTIYYRRRKGTVRILEELVSDICGWDGKVVENFKRLARMRHGLDPHPASLAGPLSRTQPGGWADLRTASASELADGPFDEYFHTADMRQHRGHKGRYGIPKLAFHLYRLTSFEVREVLPFNEGGGQGFTFDPSGRNIPLFVRRDRADNWEQWRSAQEWELPTPMRCRLLGHEEYQIDEPLIDELVNTFSPALDGAPAAALQSLRNQRFRNRERLLTSLIATGERTALVDDVNVYRALLAHALASDCGKAALLRANAGDEASIAVDAGAPVGLISRHRIQAGQLSNWTAAALPETQLVISPEEGRLLHTGAAPGADHCVTYHYGFAGNIGAGPYTRSEVENCEPTHPIIFWDAMNPGINAGQVHNDRVNEIGDSKTYTGISNKNAVRRLTLQAANGERPYICLTQNWRLTSGVDDARLSLDGLWIGGENTVLNPGQKGIEIIGDYECVVISHCTIDPGGDIDARERDILPVPIIIRGTIENMYIVSSIIGPIFTMPSGSLERLTVQDSIVQAVGGGAALALNDTALILNRVTVFGAIEVHRLEASESILTEKSSVTDTQNGCFRFSAAPTTSRLPQPYESYLFDNDTQHWFGSRKFGQPAYGQLSETAPKPLRRGAENGSEMGAFSHLINPIKLDSLKAKVAEYMPFGLIPIFINET
ncbi:MAG: hypothetical protein AAGG75_03155 [Bacteroidota bacterium]